MMVQPVILWTDALVFLLVALAILFAWMARGREHLRAPWRHVVRSRVGMASLVVIAVYVAIGLLDSVHYHPLLTEEGSNGNGPRHSAEVMSLFDALVAPLREKAEKTYSAPLAWRLYAKESIERPDGSVYRDYPRLKHGGAHLQDPEQQRWPDIRRRVVLGVAKAAVAWGLVAALFALLLARRNGISLSVMIGRLARGETAIPWRTVLVTIGLVLATGFVVVELAEGYHVLGTDKVGEDVLYQALKSVRTGLVIGTLTTLVMLPAAILLGIMAGYFRGWVDDIIQYLYTTLSSVPGVLLIAAAILMLQVYMNNHPEEFESLTERADLRLLFLCIILGITSWTSLCRYLRGEALKLREVDYVQAAVNFGVGHFTIIGRHILPNVLHIVLITVVLDFSGLVLAEAVLSYVNIGVDPSMNSWGNMINSARLEMARDPIVWWSLAAAMVFMFVLVLCANLFADVVRDAFDPRLRNSRE
ncbi:MAG TPA: ABC transporter permease [Chromatiales bacterium]|nr:ABC transporter permease [Chromatiales bacterium]